MKVRSFLTVLFLSVFIYGFSTTVLAQSEPVLYFCEKYDSDDGEVNVSDRFTTGYLTVMVKSAYPLGLEDCHIQFSKYNHRTGKFEFYKKFDYTIESDMKYVFFKKNSESDMKFEDPGFYRVYLLDDDDKTVASALIEIVDN
jgi:hypothetical protein